MDIIEIDVKWHDAKAGGGGWESIEYLIHDVTLEYCLTRGYLIYEDEDCIKVAQTIGESGYLNQITIPKGCVKTEKRRKCTGNI